jgi:glycerol-3-phosphate dehydrogenase
MKREVLLKRLDDTSFVWDVVVVGGGASGLGAAVDAASRGYSTLLLEQGDFAKGTSSRSTKLIHGGVRYLRQGHIGLVREALHERSVLRRLAPHLVRDLGFVVPLYDWWEGPFYGLGFKLYDALAGDLGLAASRRLSRKATLERIPTVEPKGLRGGVIYHDAQFDDARLAVSLARTLEDIRGAPLNYMKVVRLRKAGGRVAGVFARDQDHPDRPLYEIRARVVINATGVFCDALRRLDRRGGAPLVRASQGVHLVLDRAFLPGDSAIMVPHTDDGRVLFAVPWHDRVLLGTTDTPVKRPTLEPRALRREVDFLLRHAARYLARKPDRSDVRSVFAGLRPLFRSRGGSTAGLSREHVVEVSPSGLVTLAGGKWTTYRRMGEDAVNRAAEVARLEPRPSQTLNLLIHGWTEDPSSGWAVYGSDTEQVRALAASEPAGSALLHPRLPCTEAEVLWGARCEMARTVEDVLARRTRALLLDARASAEAAPRVAALLARELGRDTAWQTAQVRAYQALARRYLP